MWGKRYNRDGDYGKHWYIWVSCSATKPFCLCLGPEVSRMCLCWQIWERVGIAAFPVLSLKSLQIKLYLPQRIPLLCTGSLRRVSACEPICAAFPAEPGKLPQECRTGGLSRFWPKLRTGFRGAFFPPFGGASRAPGCPPSASPSPKGVFRAEARTHFISKKGGKYERKSQKKSDPEYPPDTG